MRLYLLFLSFGLGLASCTYPPANVISEYPNECASGEKPSSAVLLFVTERVPNCVARPTRMTKFRGSELLYGGADRSYQVHFYSKADWLAELHNRLTNRRNPVLFVHGYNNGNLQSLTDAFAIQRAVQPGGEAIAFIWPSYHRLISYTGDEANADWATDGLSQLLTDLGSDRALRASRLTILAHSMGNRIVLDALRLMPQDERSDRIARFVMASPDVDRAKAIAELPRLHLPVTIYGSRKDQALTGSWRVHGLPRAGDLSTWITGHRPDFALRNSTEIDVVDTSSVSRGVVHHGDYIETPEGTADLCRVVNDDHPERGRVLDPRGHWLLLKNKYVTGMDRCEENGRTVSAWLRSH